MALKSLYSKYFLMICMAFSIGAISAEARKSKPGDPEIVEVPKAELREAIKDIEGKQLSHLFAATISISPKGIYKYHKLVIIGNRFNKKVISLEPHEDLPYTAENERSNITIGQLVDTLPPHVALELYTDEGKPVYYVCSVYVVKRAGRFFTVNTNKYAASVGDEIRGFTMKLSPK